MDDDAHCGTPEREVVKLLADGQTGAARQRLRQVGPGPPCLLARLVELDIRSREMRTDLPELQQLQDQIARSPEALSRYGLWAAALIAERMFIDGDPAVGAWARGQLATATEEPYPPFPVLYARARLWRIACTWPAPEPSPGTLATCRERRDRAVRDFVRCGFHVEAAVTKAATAGLAFLVTQEDPWDARDRIEEARAVLATTAGSWWIAPLHALRGLVAFLVGDMPAAHAAWDEVEREIAPVIAPVAGPTAAGPTAAGHPMVWACTRVGRALARLIGSRDDGAVRAAESAVTAWHAFAPQQAAGLHLTLAHVLADLGRPEVTRHVGPAVDALAPGAASRLHHELLRVRADLATGVVPAAGDVKDRLGELAQLHLRRQAGMLALRIARDFERLGHVGDGQALRGWGLGLLPQPREQTLWELALSRPPGRPSNGRVSTPAGGGSHSAGTVEINVIGASLVVEVGGQRRPLGDRPAKLLLALALSHPSPVHVEQAADLLWPGLAFDRVPRRLNTVVHRLRRSLAPEGHVVVRDGDVLGIAGDHVTIDLVAYRGALAGGPAVQQAALAAVRGNLCGAQFPYDEWFVRARQRFVAEWIAHARRLVAHRHAGGVADLGGALAALDLGPEDIDAPHVPAGHVT